MKYSFCIFLFCYISPMGRIVAQPLYLDLKSVPIEIKERKFYISGVLDGRSDTSKVGWSLLNEATKGRAYHLKGGLVKQLGAYFEQNLPKDSSQLPLLMQVGGLLISEGKKIMREGHAQLVVRFFRQEEGGFGKVFETKLSTESISEFGKDIYTSHERKIRFLLTASLKRLNESRWQDVKPDYITLEEIAVESQAEDTLSKRIQDSVQVFQGAKEKEMGAVTLGEIHYSKGLFPAYTHNEEKHGTLWPFKGHFNKLHNNEVNKLFSEYKARFKLSFFVLGIGTALVIASFLSEDVQETGMPNISLLLPGTVFLGCSIPIYFRAKKLGRSSVDKYNSAIQNK